MIDFIVNKKGLLTIVYVKQKIHFITDHTEKRQYKLVTQNMRKCARWGIFFSTDDSVASNVSQLEFDDFTANEESKGRFVNCCNGTVWRMAQFVDALSMGRKTFKKLSWTHVAVNVDWLMQEKIVDEDLMHAKYVNLGDLNLRQELQDRLNSDNCLSPNVSMELCLPLSLRGHAETSDVTDLSTDLSKTENISTRSLPVVEHNEMQSKLGKRRMVCNMDPSTDTTAKKLCFDDWKRKKSIKGGKMLVL